MSDTPQSYATHTRWVPGYHFVTGPLVYAYLLWSLWRVVGDWSADRLYDLVGALALAGVFLFARLFPLRAQDRVIRLEERLRLERLLPADLAARIGDLRPRHLVALRFASDAEVPDLVRQVLAHPAMTPKAIKQQVQSWRADHLRV